MKITLIPILKDNYCYLLQDGEVTCLVDPGDADPVIEVLEDHALKPDFIFNTHHHWDHVNGNLKIKEKYGCALIAPEKDRDRIKSVDIGLSEGQNFTFGSQTMHVIETPGHTTGAVCLYFPDADILFTGDTVFAAGCGRLFEGTPQDMFESFAKIKGLPPQTKIYCGHEYTLANLEFADHVMPNSADIQAAITRAQNLRDQGQPTLPTTLNDEIKTNPFMMASNAEEFANFRSQKDNF